METHYTDIPNRSQRQKSKGEGRRRFSRSITTEEDRSRDGGDKAKERTRRESKWYSRTGIREYRNRESRSKTISEDGSRYDKRKETNRTMNRYNDEKNVEE